MNARTALWVSLAPSRHFVATERRARRCGMCHRLIAAGEQYFASWTIQYKTAVRLHADCCERYSKIIYLEKNP